MSARTGAWRVILGVVFSVIVVRGCQWGYAIWGLRSEAADPLFRFVQDGKAGYIDASGKVVIPPSLPTGDNSLGVFHEGLMRVPELKGSQYDGARYVDRSGTTVFHTDAWIASDFYEGLAMAAPFKGDIGKWGFIDRTGKFLIEPRFYSVGDFSEGLARISVNAYTGDVGYIDNQGNFVIPPKLSFGYDFHEGLAAVIISGPCEVTNSGGCARSAFRPTAKSPDYDCRFSFIDKSGKPASELRFDDAADFSEGLGPVMLDAHWGYVDHSVQVVIQPQFDWAEPFSEGLAEVGVKDKVAFIDRYGRFVIQPQFRAAESFSNGRAVVTKYLGHGKSSSRYIDKTGKPAFPGEFPLASSFHHGLAHVALNDQGKFAYIDTSGKTVFSYDEGRVPRRRQ